MSRFIVLLVLGALGAAALGTGCEDPVFKAPAPPVIDSPEKVVEALSRAYQNRDVSLFESILAHDTETNADYLFFLSAPTDLGETHWDYAEEMRIHQRMFTPQNPPEGDPPVDPRIWPQSIQITLTRLENFGERTDLYTTQGGPLDPAIWRAADARYATYVFFDLAETAYKVEGKANFVVIEDHRKNNGDAGKYLLSIWEDIPFQPSASILEAMSWSHVKSLYR